MPLQRVYGNLGTFADSCCKSSELKTCHSRPALEASTDSTLLESRLTKLEVRIEDNDISHIGTEIQELRGQIENTADKVAGIVIPSTSEIESDIRVLETEVEAIEGRLEKLGSKVEKITSKKSNPLL